MSIETLSSETVSALFVQTDGSYYGLPGVDPWDEARDARLYDGPHPVVSHPPCSRWCQLAYINQKRYGHKVGDDGGCFLSAVHAVRLWGGVLEHPAFSYAWAAYGLRRPVRGVWLQSTSCTFGQLSRTWVTEVSQSAYGHRARKRTWLYYAGPTPPPLDWSEPKPTAQVSFCKNHGNSPLPRLSKKEASKSPPAFRDMLISLARLAYESQENRHVA